MKKLFSLALIAASVALLSACSPDEDNKVKVAINTGPDEAIWKVVEQVAKTAAPVNELTDTAFPALQGQSVYRIRARLAEDYIVAYGERQALMAGMQFEADMVQDERRIYEWMLEPLFSVTARMAE